MHPRQTAQPEHGQSAWLHGWRTRGWQWRERQHTRRDLGPNIRGCEGFCEVERDGVEGDGVEREGDSINCRGSSINRREGDSMEASGLMIIESFTVLSLQELLNRKGN